MPQPSVPVGQRFRFRQQEFWAENGLVRIEDQNTGDFKSYGWKEALYRAQHFSAMARVMQHADERIETIRCVENLCECAKEARNQGDPLTPEAAAQRAKEARPIQAMMDGSDARTRQKSSAPAYFLPINNPKDPGRVFVPGIGKATLLPSHEFKKLVI